MLTRRQLLWGSGATGAFLAAGSRLASAAAAGDSLSDMLAKHAEQLLRESPQLASALGLDADTRAALKRGLDNESASALARSHARCAARLKDLESIDRKRLKPSDKFQYEAAVYANQLGVEGGQFDYGDNTLLAVINENITPYVVTQQTGAVNAIPDFLDSQHKIESAGDAADYLARLAAFAGVLDQQTERIHHDAALGVIPPDFILDTALAQISAFRGTAAADSSLVSSLARRASAARLRGDYNTRAAYIVEKDVHPALDRQIAALQTSRRRATSEPGVSRLPHGEAYYAWALKVGTSTSIAPKEAHQLGLDETAAIGAQMDALLKKQGLSQGSVGERISVLRQDPRNLFTDSDKGRADLTAYLNERIEDARRVMPRLSRLNLKAPVIVKRVPVEIELGQPLGYMQSGPLDGSRPSVYYINLHDMTNWARFTLPSLTYHETIPGHVWQGAFVNERNTISLFNRMLGFNAYVEGWALYAEQLADEIGLYERDPLGRLGYLQLQQLRAARLVADTGIHFKRWSREKTLSWLAEATGAPGPALASEVDRYCVLPGQACGYKVGHREILRLRASAQTALGQRYDLRDFNDAVVTAGPVPLTVLAAAIDAYISSTAGPASGVMSRR
jgi:uncharacterized protein (DUF885 family)